MHKRDLIVIGASAGGVEALSQLVGDLPEDLSAAVLVVLHLPSSVPSRLSEILQRAGRLPAAQAGGGDQLMYGRVLVAPPDQHLLVGHNDVVLSRGPTFNRHRPAIDLLFRSAALHRGERVIGVMLSGTLDDGASALAAIRSAGGVAVVQDPDDALYPALPRHAIAAAQPEHVVPLHKMGALLVELTREPSQEPPPAPTEPVELEADMALQDMATGRQPTESPSEFSCPDCNGVLFHVQEGRLTRFRCRVGHGWSPAGLMAEQGSALEGALWAAVRSLEERAALSHRVAPRAQAAGNPLVAQRLLRQADDDEERAAVIRKLLVGGLSEPDDAVVT